MLKVALVLAGLLGVVACGGGEDAGYAGSPTPTPAPCSGTPVPSAASHDIELPRVGGDYTRQVPVEVFVLEKPGALVSVEIVTLEGGLLGSSRLEVGRGRRGSFYKVDEIIVIQAIPDKTRACALMEGADWRAEIPIRVGGANP